MCKTEDVTYAEAEEFCTSAGARLCSDDELQTNEAKGSGCDLDKARVWSSTPVAIQRRRRSSHKSGQ